MKAKRMLAFSLALLGLIPWVNAATINFDDFAVTGSTSTAAANRYQGLGVIFAQPITVENVSVAEPGAYPAFLSIGGSGTNALPISGAAGSSVSLSFVLPNTTTPAFTDSFQALFFDTEAGSSLGTLQAYDANNVLLASATMTTPATLGAVLQVNAPGISRIVLSTDADGADVDNFTFGTPVPEPSSALLLGMSLGATILGSRRFWRRS